MTLVAVAAAGLVAGFVIGRISAARRYRRRVSQLNQQNNRREDGLCAVIDNLRAEKDRIVQSSESRVQNPELADGGAKAEADRLARICQRALEYFKGTPGPFRFYVNPMRDDGVFVGQVKPLKPYPGVSGLHGEPIFPAVPDGRILPYQVPDVVAERVLEILNSPSREVAHG